MHITDSHCHLYYEPYINNLKEMIRESKSNNVSSFLSISVDLKTSLKNIEISSKYDEIFCTIGLHPNNVCKNFQNLDKILDLYKPCSKILGIGEAGIDLYRSKNNLDQQVECFEKQIKFSIKNKLPLIIHSREAEKETINVLKKYANQNFSFIIHCFSGSENFAMECLNMNGFISFGGIITFKNSTNLSKICKKIPMDRVLVETDSPYLSPHPYRGKVNHPKNTLLIVEKIAQIKDKSIQEISEKTTDNFIKLFKLTSGKRVSL